MTSVSAGWKRDEKHTMSQEIIYQRILQLLRVVWCIIVYFARFLLLIITVLSVYIIIIIITIICIDNYDVTKLYKNSLLWLFLCNNINKL